MEKYKGKVTTQDELLELCRWTVKNWDRLLAEEKIREQLRDAERRTPRFGQPGYRPKLHVVKTENN